MTAYILKMIDGNLAVVGNNGQVLPMSVLDKHRMVSNRNQICRGYWDEKWKCWSYEVLNVKPGIDVTGFIDENGG